MTGLTDGYEVLQRRRCKLQKKLHHGTIPDGKKPPVKCESHSRGEYSRFFQHFRNFGDIIYVIFYILNHNITKL